MLANFLHIHHAELVALLHQVGIMQVFGKMLHFNRQALIAIIHSIEEAEYTKTRLSYDDSKPHDYHLIRLGRYSNSDGTCIGAYTFTQQSDMRHAGLLLVKQPFFSKYHWILKEYIHELLKNDGIVQPTK